MNEYIPYFSSLISIILLIILLFWLYQDYCLDAFRQKMFNLRDELFDEAYHGKIGFDDDAYGMLRSAMNGMIRFGHKFNLVQVLFMMIVGNKKGYKIPSFHDRLMSNIRYYSEEQQKLVMRYYISMNFYAIKHLFLSSILFLITVICPLLFLWKTHQGISKVVCNFKGPLDKIDSAALTTGRFNF